jgi:hypothetical protein
MSRAPDPRTPHLSDHRVRSLPTTTTQPHPRKATTSRTGPPSSGPVDPSAPEGSCHGSPTCPGHSSLGALLSEDGGLSRVGDARTPPTTGITLAWSGRAHPRQASHGVDVDVPVARQAARHRSCRLAIVQAPARLWHPACAVRFVISSERTSTVNVSGECPGSSKSSITPCRYSRWLSAIADQMAGGRTEAWCGIGSASAPSAGARSPRRNRNRVSCSGTDRRSLRLNASPLKARTGPMFRFADDSTQGQPRAAMSGGGRLRHELRLHTAAATQQVLAPDSRSPWIWTPAAD